MGLWSDARFALRQLRKAPGFTSIVIATLALCIGVNTAVFSVLDAVLLRGAPYPEPDRLAAVVTASPGGGAESINTAQTGALFETVRDHVPGLDVAAHGWPGGANFAGNDRPEYIQQQRVSAGYFRVLGVAPRIGREFNRQEDVPQGMAVAILSHAFWQRAFQGDPTVPGRAISLRGEEFTVVGIMPRDFRTTSPVDVWTPLRPTRDGEGVGTNYGVIARLRPGVGWAQAGEQLRSLSQALNAGSEFSRAGKNLEERIIPLETGVTRGVRSELLLTWAAVLLVLLIGCVNIAGLLLARSGTRGREIATRMALGGSRGAIVRQLLMESVLLALGGGIVGIGVGGFALDWLKQLGAEKNQLWYPIDLDARVLAVMLSVALLTSLLFGLVPALHTSRLDIRGVLNEAGRGIAGGRGRWTRGALVATEVALSLVLLIGAGLMLRTLVWLNGLNPGFDTRNVVAAEASLQDARYQTSAAVNRLYTQTLERMRRIPGVQSAAVALTLPYEQPLNNGFRALDGTDREQQIGEVVYATAGYFETMRIPLVAGRGLRDSDTAGSAKIVVVSRSLAARYFARGGAVGRHVDLGGGSREIVGICGDVQQHSGITSEGGPLSIEPTLYVPASQTKDGFLQTVHIWFSPKWVIRTSGPTANLSGQIRAAVTDVDPKLPVAQFRTVDQLRNVQTGSQRYLAAPFSIPAGLALLLAAVGLYGMISQSIAQRRHEIGIRLALGATARQTIAGVMRPGLLLSIAGIGAGLGMSLVAVRYLRSMLWGVRETDPVTFVATAAILLAVAALSSLAPALRILRMDPAETLRNE
ncbi:MAG: ABC transporter permease [Candidatus Solibacter sp.]|nr:ABC transporter permease [Candidatus Solibacter sp.]